MIGLAPLPFWEVVANGMSSFWKFCHYQQEFIPKAVCSLLTALNYYQCYTRLTRVQFVFGGVHRFYPDTVPRAELLT